MKLGRIALYAPTPESPELTLRRVYTIIDESDSGSWTLPPDFYVDEGEHVYADFGLGYLLPMPGMGPMNARQ